jgi:hypothetical protein
MWPLAIVAGIVASAVAWLLAERCSRAGWQVTARLIQLARWPVLAASIAVAVGLARHRAVRTLIWTALAIIGGGLAGPVILLAGYATYRFFAPAGTAAATRSNDRMPIFAGTGSQASV